MSIKTAQLVVKCLENQGVEIIFGIPGAKIDSVFDALVSSKIRLIVCRHEQNAAFMAAAYGRRTGKPGVVLVTSGPGVGNLTTGLLTATTEGDPVVAIAGNVPLGMKFKETHQNTDNARLLAPVTKSSIEVTTPETVPEAFANAFRIATAARSGACYISLPQDVLMMESEAKPSRTVANICYGHATLVNIDKAAEALSKASSPMLLLGEDATIPENVSAIQHLVRKHQVPVVCTYQGAGVIPKELMNCFYGRVGLFKNQPGDRLIAKSDLIITVGFNLVEYDPEVWNAKEDKEIIHIDSIAANIHNQYQPSLELLGNIHDNINLLADTTSTVNNVSYPELQGELNSIINSGKNKIGKGDTIHPLRFIHELNKVMDQNTVICCDIGSVYMWLARYLFSNHPHQILFSNGQQTLGVALPWALSTKLTVPKKKVISISGDGGFLFSAMELETAVREKIQFTHFIWTDGCYNMVKEQQIMKYNRTSGVNFGAINIPKFAESFGAKGYAISDPNDIVTTLEKAQAVQSPTLIDIAIDYSDNPMMFLDAHNPDLVDQPLTLLKEQIMFKITELNDHYETLAYIGHVDNVIEGLIPENLVNRRFLASDFEYGFELASPQGIYNLGESILLNDMIYSSRTDISRSERDPLMWGPEFVTSGIFLIPKGTTPNLNAKYFSFQGELTLADLYQDIFDKIQCPFAVVGCVELSKVYAKSITRAPIHHENIFKNSQEYYTEKDYIEENVNLAITAVVSDHNDSKMAEINEKLSSVLYYNPFAKNNNLLAHTHALLLNKPIIDIEDVRPKNAKEVLHLLDHSIIRYVNFKIYRIADLTCLAS